mmetsp:Transcript_2840/g.9778  ORF Transcript_2840/g.9778 Transcript_2840/m.9778 type:complete len:229 (+) Transcript_2840:824-1510(+)
MRSQSLPGVAITTSGRAVSNASTCSARGIPPVTQRPLWPVRGLSLVTVARTCFASSRVGTSTSVLTGLSPPSPSLSCSGSRCAILHSSGKRKAKVFPVPVSAFALTSWPRRHTGQTRRCTSVGVKPSAAAAFPCWAVSMSSRYDNMAASSSRVTGTKVSSCASATARDVGMRSPLASVGLPVTLSRLWSFSVSRLLLCFLRSLCFLFLFSRLSFASSLSKACGTGGGV